MHLAAMSIKECDELGYWRRSLRRRSKAELFAMSALERGELSSHLTAARRRAVRERLKRRRPEITEAAIRDMLFNHAVRDSEWERSIAERWAARYKGS
jgi:hypothetical protein